MWGHEDAEEEPTKVGSDPTKPSGGEGRGGRPRAGVHLGMSEVNMLHAERRPWAGCCRQSVSSRSPPLPYPSGLRS